jgi:alkaline phosphatase D
MTISLPRRSLIAGALASGLAPAFLRHSLAASENRFALGVASGFPRPDGLVLWTRLTGEALPARVSVDWELADDERFQKIVARGSAVAEADWAHSVHAEPQGLAPGRWYWYRFRALGAESPPGRTRTAPTPGAAATLDFSIASCQRYDVGRYAAWRQMSSEPLDLVLFLGDYIYENASAPGALRRHEGGEARTLSEYRARYTTYKADPQLQAAHAAFPWICIWDDHEVENDYANLRGQTLDQDFTARRAAAYQACWENLPYPLSARPVGPNARIWGATDWGNLARILAVDGRQYRDAQVCTKPGRGGSNTVTLKECPALADLKRSLLGNEQEQWLSQAWDSTRPWNLLAQTTLMSPFSWSDPAGPEGGTWWTDGWDGYAPARERLLASIAERRLGGAVVLGGDVHAHYVSDLKRAGATERSPILASEFCGSSITSLGLAQSRIDAACGFNPHIRHARSDQRGYIAFHLDARGLDARMMAVDDATLADSPVRTSARFHVEAGRPGTLAA